MRTVGSHFAMMLERRNNGSPGNYAYESARASLYSLLKSTKSKRIHIPNYACEAISDAAAAANCQVVRYQINAEFLISTHIDLREKDLVLLVDYFGLTEASIAAELTHFPSEMVIIDCSQAYFQPAFECLANIYSPRKFIPVADGGFIKTAIPLICARSNEDASINRFQYLLRRMIDEPESSRNLYIQAENELKDISRRSMSEFSLQLVSCADHEYIKRVRRDNFLGFSRLSPLNKLRFQLCDQVPLCYPLMINNAQTLREKLIEHRIFTPRYWPNVEPLNSFEMAMLNDVVFLPVDHRVTNEDVSHIVDIVLSFTQKDSK